ncbi:ABC transporter ATP-binding protein [Cohnella rhizosphaerae]|uniref:ABC transporter ATP-binding protein n=1 Tax=Cohnella rhizosphaerae TaxID=1457232 RepID=A0A9X4QT68_9BACL|nr:ABC transporter ATP-binding protein [Cohnella rhizosphaerae]MDG0810059.1 ABC transporter ATP-binding protein [Cohnella rhizosphaerae]
MGGESWLMRAAIRAAGYELGNAVLRDVAIEVGPGERVGLLGPNGAGKSTVMKGLLGQLPYWDADVRWREANAVAGGAMNGRLAYIPEQPILYERFTLWEHLQLAAAVCGISEERLADRAEGLLARFRLRHVKDDYPIKFSKGMQQKTMLVAAFLLEPSVYLVDEPFIGLDPAAVMELLEALDEERARGAGVLLTTHVLDSAERLCDRFVLVHEGGAAASGTVADIRAASGMPDGTPLFDCFHRLTRAASAEGS